MILPTKHIPPQRSLLGMGADILRLMNEPSTVANLWDKLRKRRSDDASHPTVSYHWFVLSLDLLFLLGAIDIHQGLLLKATA